jgi:hypothetical protein
MLNTFNPEALPPALKAAMVLYQQAKPVTAEGQPTIAGGILNALNPQQQMQMGQPPSMGDVVAQAEDAVPTQQQNAQIAAAQQMQGAAQGEVPPPDAGIAGLPASNTPQFKEGGVIGFAVGGMPTQEGGKEEEEEEEATSDLGDLLRQIASGVGNWAQRGNDAYKLRMQQQALRTSPWTALTPTERASREAQGKELEAKMAALYGAESTQPKQDYPTPQGGPRGSAGSATKEGPQDDDYTKLLAMLSAARSGGVGGGGGAGSKPMGTDDLASQAEAIRDRLVKPADTSPLKNLEAMIAKHYAERPDIEGDALKGIEDARAQELQGRGMRELLDRFAAMGQYGSSGLLRASADIAARRAQADKLYREEVIQQRLAQQAIKDGNFKALAGIQDKLQDINNKQAELESRGGVDIFGNVATMDVNRLNRAAQAANTATSARARLAAAMMRDANKAPVGMGIADLKTLNDMVQRAFKNPNTPVFREYVGSLPNGEQLLIDLTKKNKTIDDPDVAPKIALAMGKYKNDLINQTKFAGQQQIPTIGSYLSSAAEEDADDTDEE